jgi:hypothetical protein
MSSVGVSDVIMNRKLILEWNQAPARARYLFRSVGVMSQFYERLFVPLLYNIQENINMLKDAIDLQCLR